MDVIKLNVPTFIRILELVREEIKNDIALHDIAEVVTVLSKKQVITMDDYDAIIKHLKAQGHDHVEDKDAYESELNTIKSLGGIN